MPKYIESEALKAVFEEDGHLSAYVEEMIDSIPAADVRPVVLCRDCYAYRRDNELAEAAYLDPKMYCGLLRCEMGEDSFCSYGKRKEET